MIVELNIDEPQVIYRLFDDVKEYYDGWMLCPIWSRVRFCPLDKQTAEQVIIDLKEWDTKYKLFTATLKITDEKEVT